MTEIRIRRASADAKDARFIVQVLGLAAAWRPAARPSTSQELLGQPNTAVYVENWGRPGDVGVIAESDEGAVGAAWFRLFTPERHGYGFLDPAVPELSVAVSPGMRRRGVGRALLQALIGIAYERSVLALSLSVEEDNPARRLYEQLGFRPVTLFDGALTMRLDMK